MKKKTIWCDHCNAHISISGVNGCLRRTCRTKALVEQKDAKAS